MSNQHPDFATLRKLTNAPSHRPGTASSSAPDPTGSSRPPQTQNSHAIITRCFAHVGTVQVALLRFVAEIQLYLTLELQKYRAPGIAPTPTTPTGPRHIMLRQGGEQPRLCVIPTV